MHMHILHMHCSLVLRAAVSSPRCPKPRTHLCAQRAHPRPHLLNQMVELAEGDGDVVLVDRTVPGECTWLGSGLGLGLGLGLEFGFGFGFGFGLG
jgi:hypothetical protein